VVDRLVQPAQIERGGGEHAQREILPGDAVRAPHHDRGERRVRREPGGDDIARHLQQRVAVRPQMAAVEPTERLVVRALAPEGLHGTDAADGLGELDDDGRHRRGPAAVDALGAVLEVAYQQRQRYEARQRRRPETGVQPEQGQHDVDDGDDDGEQLLKPLVQQFAQRSDVGRGAGDETARGVAVMEVDVEGLGVTVDPPAQLQQHPLVDTGGRDDERVLEAAGGERADEIGDADGHERAVRAAGSGGCLLPGGARTAQRRYGVVDRVGDEQRTRLHRGLLEQQQKCRGGHTQPERAEQRGEQGARGVRGSGQDVALERVGRGRSVPGSGRRAPDVSAVPVNSAPPHPRSRPRP
jgi:hypothetical protein